MAEEEQFTIYQIEQRFDDMAWFPSVIAIQEEDAFSITGMSGFLDLELATDIYNKTVERCRIVGGQTRLTKLKVKVTREVIEETSS